MIDLKKHSRELEGDGNFVRNAFRIANALLVVSLILSLVSYMHRDIMLTGDNLLMVLGTITLLVSADLIVYISVMHSKTRTEFFKTIISASLICATSVFGAYFIMLY